jgi:hypothetical protein
MRRNKNAPTAAGFDPVDINAGSQKITRELNCILQLDSENYITQVYSINTPEFVELETCA